MHAQHGEHYVPLAAALASYHVILLIQAILEYIGIFLKLLQNNVESFLQ